MRGIIKNNPFVLNRCERTKCPYTLHNEDCNEKCRIERVVYRAVCVRCEDLEHCYEGETSRTLLTRSLQHTNDYRLASKRTQVDSNDSEKSSWMWEHVRDSHGGVINTINPHLDFKFSMVSSHKDSMERQIKEAIRIKSAFGGSVTKSDFTKQKIPVKCLNRKGEFFAPIERFEKEF